MPGFLDLVEQLLHRVDVVQVHVVHQIDNWTVEHHMLDGFVVLVTESTPRVDCLGILLSPHCASD